MGRKRLTQTLDVFMNTRLVGQYAQDSSGAISFRYDQSWIDWEHTLPISKSLPLREDAYRGEDVIAVFENMLPDNQPIRKKVAERVGARGTDAFSLLSVIGRDCVGALQFLPEGNEPQPTDKLTGESLDEAAIEKLLGKLGTAPLGLDRDNDFRISVAGAQEKTALLWQNGQWIEPTGTTPTTHIIKPQIGTLPIGVDLSNSVENEHACLKLMQAFGLRVANTEIANFGDVKALVVERFDRRWTEDGRLIRLPQEDCCQALSIPPSIKYQSDGGPGIVEIMELLSASDEPVRDRDDFMKANILFWMMGATDGHAKNFSIALTPGGRFQMCPLYDVISVQPSLDAKQLQRKQMRLAMRVGDKNRYKVEGILGRHFVQTAKAAGWSSKGINRLIDEILSATDGALENWIAELPDGIPSDLIDSIANAVQQRKRLLDQRD